MVTERTPSTPGRRPYGTHPGEAQTLQIMLRRRARGWAWRAIAGELNAMGRLRRNGTQWTAPAVAKIVAGHAIRTTSAPRSAP